MEKFNILRAGYDGLDVSFKCGLPIWFLERLEAAKAKAVKDKQDALVVVSENLQFKVAETGAKGGYAYRCDTGPEGETWFFKRSTKEDWNVRVSCKSAMLAKLGYTEAKYTLLGRLYELGIREVEESVGRFDMAFDFTAPEGFEIDPSLVVAHVNTGVTEHNAMFKVTPEDAEISCIASRARMVQTLTIGKMPGRQITVYNKTAEVKAKGKKWWWEIWRLPEGHQVYRLEVRAGKRYLKDRCGVTTFADLEDKMPDMVHASLLKVRLCDPKLRYRANVTERGYHPVWQEALAYVKERWAEMLKGCEPVRVIRGERKRMAEIFEALVAGTVISYANVCGTGPEGFKRFAQAVAKRLEALPDQHAHMFNRKWQKSQEKYAMLTGQVHGYESASATA